MTDVVVTIQDCFSPAAEEFIVITVFLITFALFKFLGKSRKAANKQQKEAPPHVKSVEVPSPTSRKCADQADLQPAAAPAGDEVFDEREEIEEAEAQMLKLLEGFEFTRALSLFRTFDRNTREHCFSEELISSFVLSAIRIGNHDVVERFLRSMKHRGTKPTVQFWQKTVKMLSSRKQFDLLLSIYAMFGESLPSDKVVFSCLINAALGSGTPERAVAMLDRYREAGLDPPDYVTIFRTYVAVNDVEAAEKAFQELGSNLTAMMLNMVLLTCVKTREPERALQRLHEAWTFQEARAKVAGDGVEVHEPIVDVVSYNTVIKGFAQAGSLSRCFDCLHEMRARNVEPDDVTFSTLLDMCINENDMDAASQVVDLLMRGDQPLDTVMCTSFIKGLVRARQLPKAIELYEEMKRRKSTHPDLVTYSVLIKACVDCHDIQRALQLLEDMTASGTQPDHIIFTNLLEGCGYTGNHALMKKLFDDMLAAGAKPSNYTLIAMVKSHGRCGAHEDAYQLVANWEKKHGQKPSVIHYTCLMSGCLRSRHYEQAWQAYALMLEENVRPDETTFATLLPGMVAAQNWERVLAVAKSALKPSAPVPIAAETLNSALSQMRAAADQAHLADELEALMQDANIRPSARNARRTSNDERSQRRASYDERVTANAPWQRT